MNQEKNNIYKRNVRVLIVAALLFAILLLKPYFFPGYFPAPEDQEWYVGSAPPRSLSYSQCDATNEAMFFSWQSAESHVYAYRHDGTFLYSLQFKDISNGRMHIRCQDGNLYVKLRNDNVFVFQGSNMIVGLTEDQADVQGITNDWFRSGGDALVLQNGTLYYRDDLQNLVPVTVPSQIRFPQEWAFVDSETSSMIVLICAVVVIGFIAYIAFKK